MSASSDEHRRRLVRTSGVAAATNVILLIVAVLDTTITARLLGARGKGGLFLFTTTVSVVTLVVGCGLGIALQVSVTQGRVAIGAAARFSVSIAAAVGAIAIIAALAFGSADIFGGLAVQGALLLPAELLVGLLTPLFVAADRVGRRSVFDVTGATLDLTLTAAFILSGGDRVHRAALGVVAAQWVYALMLAADLWRRGGQSSEPRWRRRALSYGLRQQPGNLFARAGKRADAFILAGFLGQRAVGVYSVASALAEIPLFLARAVQPSVISFAATIRSTNRDDVARVARTVLGVYVVVLPIYGLATSGLLRPVVGVGFGGAAAPLWILLISTAGLAFHLVLSGYFLGAGRPGLVTFIIGAPVAVNLALSFALIPTFGLVGDAVATAIGGVLTAAVALVCFCRSSGLRARAALVPRAADIHELWGIVHSVVETLRPPTR